MDYEDSDVEQKPTEKTTTKSRTKLALKKRSSRVRYLGEPLPTTNTSATTSATTPDTTTTSSLSNQPQPLPFPSTPSTSTNVTIVPETPQQHTNQPLTHPSNTPLYLHDELAGIYQSYLFHQSRIPIYQNFAKEGPLPDISKIRYHTDPFKGLTRSHSQELRGYESQLQTKICLIHASNHEKLASDEMSKAIALISSAKEFFDAKIVEEIDERAKRTAFNKAQTNKHQKRNQRREDRKRPRT